MKDDWTRIEQTRIRDRERTARTTRAASEPAASESYHLPDSTINTETCEECGSRVVYIRDEWTCEECGLVQR